MRSYLRACVVSLFLAAACVAAPRVGLSAEAAAREPEAPPHVAVLSVGPPSDDARRAARAVYRGRLRPPSLDEQEARALVGDLEPGAARGGARELAELRAGVRGDDAASRQLLAAIGRRLAVRGILVVTIPAAPDGGAPRAAPIHAEPAAALADDAGIADDAGDASLALAGDAGVASDPAATLAADARGPSPEPPPRGRARLFLVGSASFDAASYSPDDATGWGATVASLERLMPAELPSKPSKSKDESTSRPFYTSPWFWGGLGAAALFGGAFFFASRDTSGETIHLQMKVPQ